jgi:hypothetical protein
MSAVRKALHTNFRQMLEVGNLFEADFGCGRIQKIAPNGTVSVEGVKPNQGGQT